MVDYRREDTKHVKRGFTLIELLIVIAVISLLMELLIPALRSAREQGQRAVCLSNLRQLTLAWTAYAAEYDGVLVKNETCKRYRKGGMTLSMADGHAEYWKWRGGETLNFRRELLRAGNLFLNMVTEVYMGNSGLLEGGIKC